MNWDFNVNAFTESVPYGTDGEKHPMALLLDEIDDSLLEPRYGDVHNGIIVDKRSNELLVDIGFKSEGVVTGREIERVKSMVSTLVIGDEIPVYILREENDGSLNLSISRALAEKDWERAEQLMEEQSIFEADVEAFNRGGVIVKLGEVRGFVPASQMSPEIQEQAGLSPRGRHHHNRDEQPQQQPQTPNWEPLMGKTLQVKVIDIDRERNRLILSERLAMREWRRRQKEQLLESLNEGDTYEGTISSIADFGAFVDLGGADGLIHLSELSWNRVNHPKEIVKVGETVKVQILTVDRERRRIGLSLRRLQPQPWEIVDQLYEVGKVVKGTITKLVNFGAFARLNDYGIEGLIHISELAEARVKHPKEVVTEGQEFDLRIIRIDTNKRRMGLSIKQALPPEEKIELDWQIAPSNGLAGDNTEDISAIAESVSAAMDIEDDSTESMGVIQEAEAIAESMMADVETEPQTEVMPEVASDEAGIVVEVPTEVPTEIPTGVDTEMVAELA